MEVLFLGMEKSPRNHYETTGVVADMVTRIGREFLRRYRVADNIYHPGRQVEQLEEGTVLFEGEMTFQGPAYNVRVQGIPRQDAEWVEDGFSFTGSFMQVVTDRPIANQDETHLEHWLAGMIVESEQLEP